jgi:TPR repeat protein
MLRGLLRWGRKGSGKGIGVFCRVGLSLRGMGSEITHTPFPLPIPEILCDTPRMKNLLILPALLLTLLMGTPASSADLRKGFTAYQSGDFATALRELKPLAEQGSHIAQTLMGVMHMNGQGFPKDHENAKIAVEWYTLAAEQGDDIAQEKLALAYYTGRGVIQDNVYAHMWWNIAASNGDTDAVNNRDILVKQMTPADISTAQNLARECVRKKYKGC